MGPLAYRDARCNFDICEVCFVNLPEKHELVPFNTPKNVVSHLKKASHHNWYSSDEEEEGNIDNNLEP